MKHPERVQRYRLTFEFLLRDRADYALARKTFRAALMRAVEHEFTGQGLVSDYMGIEKVEEPRDG